MNPILLSIALLLSAVLSSAGQGDDKQSNQQATTARELFDTIGRMDKAMFDAFNAHNTDALMSLFADDLEFYHDKGGLTNYQQTAESFRKLFSGGRTSKESWYKAAWKSIPSKIMAPLR